MGALHLITGGNTSGDEQKISLEMNRDELYQFYDQLETIQKRLDELME